MITMIIKQSQHMHNKSWKRALHARQSESREWSNDNELHELQQCKFKDDCEWRWHVARKQRREIEKIADIINLLIKTSMLKKKMSKDYSWKEIALKLMHRLRLNSEEKHHMIQNVFIAKNVQKLKTSVQLLSKQLQMQKNTCFSLKIMSWTNMTREELSTRKQSLREKSSSLCKRCEVMIKIANREEIKKMQKKIIKQILQKIADVLTSQRDLIMFLHKLSSKDIFLHAVSSDV